MARRLGNLQGLSGGISRSKKVGPPNSFAFGRSIDFRHDPSEVTINPQSSKISGSTVMDLPMGMDVAGDYLYGYGNTGRVYQIDTSDTVINEYTVPNSVGNGIGYLAEDKYLYLAGNISLSRRSLATGVGTYYANFLENEGGAPTNTRSIDFESTSSQSATRADTASLSITSDITLEAFVKPESLPTGSNTMALISKWNESGTLRSYKLSLIPVTNVVGNGADGPLTISADTTEAPIDSACTGTAGTVTLSATNASFAAGQIVFIHQSQGTNAGQNERNIISSYTAGTMTLSNALGGTYTTGAQVRVLKQYTNVTINAGVVYSAKTWNGTVGGILGFVYNGTLTVNGTMSAGLLGPGDGYSTNNQGFRGASVNIGQGEGTAGNRDTVSTGNNDSGGGGGNSNVNGGGGGGNGNPGSNGAGATPGQGGNASGSADLTTLTFGGGGGRGATASGEGGYGGGIIYVLGVTLTINTTTGFIKANGSDGQVGSTPAGSGGGGGAGGSIFLGFQTATVGTDRLLARGGNGGTTGNAQGNGGAGGSGRISLHYYTSYTGTTTPTLYPLQDDTLGSSNGYALRFYISSTGLNSETYTQNIDDPTGQWNRFAVTWKASSSTAIFYQNSNMLGTKIGALTSIHDNASIFALATFVSSGSTNTDFYDGLMDDVRVWNDVRTPSEISNYSRTVLTGNESNLVAYYKCDSTVTDSQASGLNNLTANNAPVYSTDIPFSGITTRSDQDVAVDGSGQVYTLTTALNEGATHRHTFTPTKEPMKSLALTIVDKGTGNWTVVIHDQLNRQVATMTVANADLINGVYEFIFAASFRMVLNASYHIHVYSTVADGTVATGTASDLETSYLRTYYQILVSDIYHPIKQFTNFLVIGNERYVAKLEAGSVYDPHRLILPSGYRVRCFAFWHDYIAIGTWQGSAITDVDTAKIFLWDGTSDTYVEPIDVPQGAINAMFGHQGRLFISAGYRGKFFEYTGAEEASPLFKLPEVDRADKIEIAPSAISMWNGIIQIGATLSTDSVTVHQGIYTYGKDEDSDPLSMGFDYPLSIGDQMTSAVKIGSLMPRGKKLYIGFQNGSSYGIDVVDKDAVPYQTATMELLMIDLQSLVNVKYPLTFRVDFLPLTTGQSIILKYKPDRSSTWNIIQMQANVGATEIAGSINQRVKEVQFAVDVVTNGAQVTITNFAFDAEEGKENIRYVR